MKSKFRVLGWSVMLILLWGSASQAKSRTGSLSGVVQDPSGTPQMGAAVVLMAEDGAGQTVSQLLTNQHGAFFTDVKPGVYSIRVSLAGFLPTLECHVTVVADVTTLVRVQVDTVFASLDKLRRKPNSQADSDDWKWALRSSPATRPILQWRDGGAQAAAVHASSPDVAQSASPRAVLQVTTGSTDSSSPNFADRSDLPATTFSYDQPLGAAGRLLLAGQMNSSNTSGGFSTIWLPSGELGSGPQTIFVARRDQNGTPGFKYQGVRFDHSEGIRVGQNVIVRVGAEYVRVGSQFSTSSIRPYGEVDTKFAPGWTAVFIVAESPSEMEFHQTGTLESAISDLDSLPVMLFRQNHPALASDAHQEVSLSRKLGNKTHIEAAAFHDSSQHQAILGLGTVAASEEYATPLLPGIFRYDAGASSSWGGRLAYRRQVSDSMDVAVVYSWAGALSRGVPDSGSAEGGLGIPWQEQNHHSVAARLSGKVPRTGTQLQASYKWVSGDALTREDSYGDAAYLLDPNLHISIRQPFPGSCLGGHWEALADFSNILAQGYVPVGAAQESKVLMVPALRSFRGGVSFQF